MPDECCGTCRYYLNGECHFEPAKLFWCPDEVKFRAMHPPRTPHDWCGCWKTKAQRTSADRGEELVEEVKR
ncbi:MAG: hypothetical protein JXP34_26760 [Planctomycetes bacterium]|nr:hypothetical protein [Planctomycetota bacterium]